MNFRSLFVISLLLLFIAGIYAFKFLGWIIPLILLIPIAIVGIYDITQKKHTILKNFPVVGHFRYLLEAFRPEIMQYFVETDTQGRPINRLKRSLIYSRAKKQNDTTPFGTQKDVYKEGYEWINHSLFNISNNIQHNERVLIGKDTCKQPYAASLLNISAMSFGSLSKNAVMAMNKGAHIGGFAQNTGEGGISPYHTKYQGDLIWQIGTGYFGCRDKNGNFSEENFKHNALLPSVKMIEIKLSQGAKPGHGGILPGKKNTPEIAEIRNVAAGTAVLSPPNHSAFNSPEELIKFIDHLRNISGGKPVGFKLCIGIQEEFIAICQAIKDLQIFPDFIAVDGGEGGTGAAPLEFSNAVGTPLLDGLAFVDNSLKNYEIRSQIKIIASGKILSAFDMTRVLSLGADICYSARAMMMATGCIQALLCNNNKCPVGVATQDPYLMKGLHVQDKANRVANYHKKTIQAFEEIIHAAGHKNSTSLTRKDINRRMSLTETKTYEEIYPTTKTAIYA